VRVAGEKQRVLDRIVRALREKKRAPVRPCARFALQREALA
jgi:hypothetical protein